MAVFRLYSLLPTGKVRNQQIYDKDLADDIVLFKEAKQQLQLLLDTIDEKAKNMRLTLNVSKAKSKATAVALYTVLLIKLLHRRF